MREKLLYRAFIVLFCLLATGEAFVAMGLYSNWFRYGFSLEGVFSLFFTILPVAAVLIFGGVLLFAYLPNLSLTKARKYILLFLVFASVSSYYLYLSLPEFYWDDTELSEVSNLQTGYSVLKYYVEVKNTFYSGRETLLHLVDQSDGSEQFFELPIDEEVRLYHSPAIWGTLKKLNGTTYEFVLFDMLYHYVFKIEVEKGTAYLVTKKEGHSQRCLNEESGIYYTCPINQQQFEVGVINEAEYMSTDELYRWLVDAKISTTSDFSSSNEIRSITYLDEYEFRVREDKSEETHMRLKALIDKYGPCWGIPSGQCAE